MQHKEGKLSKSAILTARIFDVELAAMHDVPKCGCTVDAPSILVMARLRAVKASHKSHKCRCRTACILAAPQCCRQTHTHSSTFAPTRWHTQQHGMWYPFIRCHGLFVKPDQTHPFIARGPQSIRSRTNLTKHNRRCSRKTCDRHAHTLRHKFSSDHTTPMHVSCPLQRIACLLRWPGDILVEWLPGTKKKSNKKVITSTPHI